MAKAPVAGTVKTRLEPLLSGKQCAALAECFLRDTVEKTKALNKPLIIAYAPPEGRGFFDKFKNHEITVHEQYGDDLGEKIYSTFNSVFERGFDSVVMIGTDSPTFPPEFVEEAFDLFDSGADAVLGKTLDGGFYLVGLLRKIVRKEIFENIEWSSPRTFLQTKENILRLKLNLKEIADWYDVDEPEDLKRLAGEFEQNESTRKTAPRTFEWVKQNLGTPSPRGEEESRTRTNADLMD